MAPYEIRSIGVEDGKLLQDLVLRSSPAARHMRFMSPKPALTARELGYLTGVDHSCHEALLALLPGGDEAVAEARYAAVPGDPAAAEVAVLVRDDWQRRGLGSQLVNLLAAKAAEEGYERLTATSMGENAGARALMRAAGFDHTRTAWGAAEWSRPVT